MRPKRKYKSEYDRKLWQVIGEIANPQSIDWRLNESDHKVITKYVEMFIRDQEVEPNKMVVSKDIYPELHRFIQALQGGGDWVDTMSAFDYLENNWPELEPILDKA